MSINNKLFQFNNLTNNKKQQIEESNYYEQVIESNNESAHNIKEDTSEEAMLQIIQERNKVINEYITNLDQKLLKENDIIEPIEVGEEDEDEFAKAEAQFKQSTKNAPKEEQISFKKLKQLYHSQVFKGKHNPTARNGLFSMRRIKRPEMLYIRENDHIRKQQSLRKLHLKIYDVLPSIKSNEKTIDKEKDNKSFLVHNQNNNLHIPLTLSMSISPKNRISKSPKDCLIEKEKKALKCLNDRNNPYSQNWSNQLLKTRFGSKIKVNGFFCGIPQLKLEKLKEMPLRNPSELDQYNKEHIHVKKSKANTNRSEEEPPTLISTIEYPFILKHF